MKIIKTFEQHKQDWKRAEFYNPTMAVDETSEEEKQKESELEVDKKDKDADE